jgi:hypothetical protein
MRQLPGFYLSQALNQRVGSRVFPAYRLCFFDKRATKQNSSAMKPFRADAKTSGNRRWLPHG